MKKKQRGCKWGRPGTHDSWGFYRGCNTQWHRWAGPGSFPTPSHAWLRNLSMWCLRNTGQSVGNITNGRDPQTYCSDDLQIRPTRAVALTLMPESSASHRGRPFTQRVLENLHRDCWSGLVVAQVTWPHRREPQPNPLNIHELIAQRAYHSGFKKGASGKRIYTYSIQCNYKVSRTGHKVHSNYMNMILEVKQTTDAGCWLAFLMVILLAIHILNVFLFSPMSNQNSLILVMKEIGTEVPSRGLGFGFTDLACVASFMPMGSRTRYSMTASAWQEEQQNLLFNALETSTCHCQDDSACLCGWYTYWC